MRHPETFRVTKEHGPRPAGPPDICFYCGRKIGELHRKECVLRDRTVVLRAVAEVLVEVPDDWDGGDIEYQYNERDNLPPEVLFISDFKYLREATREDEEFCDLSEHLINYGENKDVEPEFPPEKADDGSGEPRELTPFQAKAMAYLFERRPQNVNEPEN